MKNEQAFTTGEDAAFTTMVDAALERAPQPAIPEDFAARVAAKAVTLPQRVPKRQTYYGRAVALAAMVILGIALFALAPHVSPSLSNVAFQAEILVLLQLAGIGYWLTRSKQLSL